MNWELKLSAGENTGELKIVTEFGPLFYTVKSIDDGIWAFKIGTISRGVDGVWRGGFEINYHRYFIHHDGSITKKSNGRTGLNPYSFYLKDGVVYARLWEDKIHSFKKVFGAERVTISGVSYKISGGRAGKLIPVRGTSETNDNDLQIKKLVANSDSETVISYFQEC